MATNSKAEFAKQKQRTRIVNDSIYGCWSDSSNAIELKISPTGPYTRIRMTKVNDIVILEIISFFCGLKSIPRRTIWNGFDFITHLVRTNEYSYQDGVVHMPNASRKNRANLTIHDNSKIVLDFYFVEPEHKEKIQTYIGSLRLTKKITA